MKRPCKYWLDQWVKSIARSCWCLSAASCSPELWCWELICSSSSMPLSKPYEYAVPFRLCSSFGCLVLHWSTSFFSSPVLRQRENAENDGFLIKVSDEGTHYTLKVPDLMLLLCLNLFDFSQYCHLYLWDYREIYSVTNFPVPQIKRKNRAFHFEFMNKTKTNLEDGGKKSELLWGRGKGKTMKSRP